MPHRPADMHPGTPETTTGYVATIADAFAHLGNTISGIHQAVVTLAGQVARTEQLRTELADPDHWRGELLEPAKVADMIAEALNPTE